jgi:hypothetical protein
VQHSEPALFQAFPEHPPLNLFSQGSVAKSSAFPFSALNRCITAIQLFHTITQSHPRATAGSLTDHADSPQ